MILLDAEYWILNIACVKYKCNSMESISMALYVTIHDKYELELQKEELIIIKIVG